MYLMQPATYRVYLIRNPAGTRYIGLSEDVDRRIGQHNGGISRWTRGRGPWSLEWVSTPRSLGEARKLENLLKRQKGGIGLEPILLREGSSGS
jgi:putative endonuclease